MPTRQGKNRTPATVNMVDIRRNPRTHALCTAARLPFVSFAFCGTFRLVRAAFGRRVAGARSERQPWDEMRRWLSNVHVAHVARSDIFVFSCFPSTVTWRDAAESADSNKSELLRTNTSAEPNLDV